MTIVRKIEAKVDIGLIEAPSNSTQDMILGDIGLSASFGREHTLLRTHDGFVSLNDPGYTRGASLDIPVTIFPPNAIVTLRRYER